MQNNSNPNNQYNIVNNSNSIALARKWRPQTFNQLTGQDVIVRALSNALDTNRLHHAYLFTGTRGVGKTTLSRLLAKALSCEKGISSTPCGICNNCISIQNAQYIDYIELDAASNRGVEEISKLLENASYQPSQGRFKIFMIDEVHMLSNHAFNAMLKTLEEPPEHVKFILATTDAHKIPLTILSRCLQFHLKNLSIPSITNYLKDILKQESINFEENALPYIAKSASGSMRDALSITDQAIALGHGNIKTDDTKQMLGLSDDILPLNLLENIVNNDLISALNIIESIQNVDKFLDNLIVHLQNIAIIQCVENTIIDTNYLDEIFNISKLINAESVQIYYQMAIKAKQELNFCAGDIVLNMLCVRIIHFQLPLSNNPNLNKNTLSSYKNKNSNNSSSIDIDTKTNKYIHNSSISNTENKTETEDINNFKAIIQNQHIQSNKNNKQDIINSDSYTPINDSNKNIKINTYIEQNINNIDIANIDIANVDINNNQWLNIIPKLNLDGLSLQIAKQSILLLNDENNIHLSCEFDTSFMKNAVLKLQTALSNYLSTNILLKIIHKANFNADKSSNTTNNTNNVSIDNNIINNQPRNVVNVNNAQNQNQKQSQSQPKTLLQQEQDEKQQYINEQMQKASNDAWLNEFIKIGAKIVFE